MRVLGLAVGWTEPGRARAVAENLLASFEDVPPEIRSSRNRIAAVGVGADSGTDLFTNEEADLVVAFEGRLDDGLDLRLGLGLPADASTGCALAEAYLRHGEDLVGRLRGDFAFCLWDGARGRVLAARDPVGTRLLHYARSRDQLCLASDVEQFLAAGIVAAVPDEQMVVEFLTREARTLDRSYLKDVAVLPPGHFLVATREQIRIVDYREVPSRMLSFSSRAECYESFRERFLRSVQRRLTSGATVVAELSGGIDSTSIVCAADNLRRRGTAGIPPVVAASAIYPGFSCDETPYIDAVEKHVGIPVFRWDGRLIDGTEFLEPSLSAPGSRMPSTGGTEGFVDIARSNGAHVILDGSGGDQLGMPLGWESDELAPRDWLRLTPDVFRSPIAFSGRRPLALRWMAGVVVPLPLRHVYSHLRERWSRGQAPDWLAEGSRFRLLSEAPRGKPHSFSSREQAMRWGTLVGAPLALYIQLKQRHASTKGLEVAFPFLDWDLIQLVLAVPKRYWPRPGWLVRFQREAMQRDLPPAIYARRTKAEFTAAMINRVRRSLGQISDLCEGGTWSAGRFVDQRQARQMLGNFREAASPTFVAAYHLWAVASLEAWLRRLLSYSTRLRRGD
jgi:asparagine synthase (glutamine-hydrolysing)